MDEFHRYQDNTQKQNALQNTTSFADSPLHHLTFPIEAVVTRVIYPDEADSVRKRGMEYNLSTTFEGIPHLENVEIAQGFGFYGDGEEVVLQAATKPSDKKSKGTLGDESTLPYEETNGDRVLVAFIQATWTMPIIIARLAHQSNPMRSKTPEEKVVDKFKAKKFGGTKTGRTAVVNGTKVDLDDKGNLALTFGKHLTDSATGVKKKVTIFKDDCTTPVLTISNTGTTWKIDFGGDGTAAGQKLVLGDALQTFLTTQATRYGAHTHSYNEYQKDAKFTAPSTSSPGTNSPANTGTPSNSFPSNHDTYLSNWITSVQDAP